MSFSRRGSTIRALGEGRSAGRGAVPGYVSQDKLPPADGKAAGRATPSKRKRTKRQKKTEDIMRRWIVLWLVSLAIVAGSTSAFRRAQAPPQVPPGVPAPLPPLTAPQVPPSDARVVSGAEF